MRIDAVRLAILCASHFVIYFTYKDLSGVRYWSDYETEIEGCGVRLWCEVRFDEERRRVIGFRFDAELRCEDCEVEIDGSVKGAGQKAIAFINEYLAS